MTAAIHFPIANNEKFYLDLLTDGQYMVSEMDTKLKVFKKAEDAIFFYLSKTVDIKDIIGEPPTDEEAVQLLEDLIKDN